MESDKPATLPLPYAVPAQSDTFGLARTDSLTQFAFVRWLGPLLAGLAAFADWVVFRSEGPQLIGFLAMLVGTFAAGVGGLAVLAWTANHWSQAPRRRVLLPATLLLVLLGSNFAVAAAVLRAVGWVHAHHPDPTDVGLGNDD